MLLLLDALAELVAIDRMMLLTALHFLLVEAGPTACVVPEASVE